MKSSPDKRKARGQIDIDELKQLQYLSKHELIQQMHSSPSIRSACIRLLSEKYHNDEDYTDILLTQLQKETALYTKIEIQEQLSLYGDVKQMCQYLGEIGHNQYHEMPAKSSLKTSYPLPRDIIARSLAHMNMLHFSDFISLLPQLSLKQLQEAIDAFGFLCFYHCQQANNKHFNLIREFYYQYLDNELIIWKLTTCLSAFPQSKDFLLEIKAHQKHPTILMEVERSLKLISRLNNH